MKKHILFLSGCMVLLFMVAPVQAQNLNIKAGTKVVVLHGSDLQAVGNMDVAAGSVLNIYGDVSVSGSVSCSDVSDLVIHSDATNDGAFIFGSGTPKATVQRFVSHGQWHQVAIPVTGATVNDFYFSGNPRTWLTKWDASNNKWVYLTSLSQALSSGTGFDYYIENTDETVVFKGTIAANDFSCTASSDVPLVYVNSGSDLDGANLVGNPYTAPINVRDDGSNNWTFTNMEKTVWVLQSFPDGTFNYVQGTTSGGGGLPDGIIPMGQAFFVKVTSNNPQLVIPKERRSGNQATYFKKTAIATRTFLLEAKKDSSWDKIWVTFAQNGTNGFDNGYDASKMFGSKKAPQLYMKEDSVNRELSIDYLPKLTSSGRVVRLSFIPGKDGKQTFVGHFSNLKDVDVVLEDLQTGTLHDFTNDSIYIFQGTKKDNPDRFVLHFGKVLGIDNPKMGEKNTTIYAFDKAVYIHTKGTLQQGTCHIAIYDLMGRVVYKGVKANASTIRIPLPMSHTYVIVRVNKKNQTKVSKVYMQ